MSLAERFWACVAYLLSCLSLSPLAGYGVVEQAPLYPGQVKISPPLLPTSSAVRPSITPLINYLPALHSPNNGGPIFKPPGGALGGPGSDFVCNYTSMVGYRDCSSPENRACWLVNDKTGDQFNISTNYEESDRTPIGIHRTYHLRLADSTINADGQNFSAAKLFDKIYPGPWIQACWGDNVTVIVKNDLKYNGTSIHWHGIRQWLTMHMDGVNGVTQCPIAPGDTFNYTFRAMQYGSSWYHSHYSVQYADGANGPLTLHGPTSEPFDEAVDPILMTDWGHNSAFAALTTKLVNSTILLNGRGNVTKYNNTWAPSPGLKIPEAYSIKVEYVATRAKKYLLRLINTSFESTFVFSIDNHILQIVSADFVPIHSYTNTSVLIGIGQRYNVIVEATDPLKTDGNYWIRTYKANCFGFSQASASLGYETTGILRYRDSKSFPATLPWPVPKNVSLACSDETYTSLKPILKWNVSKTPANDPIGRVGENITLQANRSPTNYPLAVFSLAGPEYQTFRTNYGNPTFLNLNNTGPWNPQWVVFSENFTAKDWVYMAIKGRNGKTGAHPIHLHGHDFALLQQIENANFPQKLNLTWDNPPRRDVVLLPNNGYVVIAFKTDNPGAWLVHCHIAFHAGEGLAMQIMERQTDAIGIWPNLQRSHALNVTAEGCKKWNNWWGNCKNWWPGDGSSCQLVADFTSPDSGI